MSIIPPTSHIEGGEPNCHYKTHWDRGRNLLGASIPSFKHPYLTVLSCVFTRRFMANRIAIFFRWNIKAFWKSIFFKFSFHSIICYKSNELFWNFSITSRWNDEIQGRLLMLFRNWFVVRTLTPNFNHWYGLMKRQDIYSIIDILSFCKMILKIKAGIFTNSSIIYFFKFN